MRALGLPLHEQHAHRCRGPGLIFTARNVAQSTASVANFRRDSPWGRTSRNVHAGSKIMRTGDVGEIVVKPRTF